MKNAYRNEMVVGGQMARCHLSSIKYLLFATFINVHYEQPNLSIGRKAREMKEPTHSRKAYLTPNALRNIGFLITHGT